MSLNEAILWGQQSMLAVAMVSGPILLTALLVGVVVGLLQAVTQIHEMTLVFVPKIIAVFLVISVMGPWMLDQMVNFSERIFMSVSVINE
jgi:flagellar biosynthetic protein FliQ